MSIIRLPIVARYLLWRVDWVGNRVGNAVFDRRHSGGVWVANPGRLYRRWVHSLFVTCTSFSLVIFDFYATSEGQNNYHHVQSIASGVPRELNEDVDLILANHLGDL